VTPIVPHPGPLPEGEGKDRRSAARKSGVKPPHSKGYRTPCTGALNQAGRPGLTAVPFHGNREGERSSPISRKSLLERITADRNVCGGKPCIRGTRIFIQIILDSLADGMTPEEIIDHYPHLTVEDVRAAVAYAAELPSC